MGSHRADTSPFGPVPVEQTFYVGRRIARHAQEVHPAMPYVGKRVALSAEPVEVPAPFEWPMPSPRVPRELVPEVLAAPVLTPAPVLPPAPVFTPAPVAPSWPGIEAFHPAPVEVVTPPLPPVIETAPAPGSLLTRDDTGALPFALTEAFTDWLPRIEGIPGTDFSGDSTISLPMVQPGGKRRRAARAQTPPLFRRVPSLPMMAGVAALAIATTGAVMTSGSDLVSAAGPLRQASALGGTSSVGSVGTASRTTVSRDSSRQSLAAQADQAAAAMAAARSKSDKQADARAADLEANRWSLPITKGVYHLTAGFGQYGLWAHAHTGLDFACPTGTPIHAVANGTITSMGYDGAYGNKTVETLDDGTELWYAHQSAYGAKVGDRVYAGQVIGYVGSTGHVTGPHVHLEVRPGGGDPVDPYPALVSQGLQP